MLHIRYAYVTHTLRIHMNGFSALWQGKQITRSPRSYIPSWPGITLITHINHYNLYRDLFLFFSRGVGVVS